MLEQIVAQVVFDIAADVEDNEAREPANYPQHQRENDHQLRIVRDQVESMLFGRVYRVADEQGNDHRDRGVRERAKDPECVTQPAASLVEKQAFHGLSVKLSGLRRDRSGCSPRFRTLSPLPSSNRDEVPHPFLSLGAGVTPGRGGGSAVLSRWQRPRPLTAGGLNTGCRAQPCSPLLQTALIELRVFQKYVERGRHRGVQSATAVAKPAAENIKIEKPPRRIRYHLQWRERVGLLLHRRPRAEPVNRRHVIRDIAVAEMQNLPVQPLDPSLDYDLVVRIAAADMPAFAPKQPQRRVRINRVRVVMPQVVQDAPNPVAVGGRRRRYRADN